MNPPARQRDSAGVGRWPAPLVAVACACGVAGLGALFTDLGPWYAGLRQPPWKPPDAWFGPAWTLIFAFSATAATLAWRAAANRRQRRLVLMSYGLNAFLQVLWSVLFFRLRRPDWAFVEVLVLWLSIVLLIVVSARLARGAALLLLPYLAWVAFAATINFGVLRLNGPF